MVDDDEKGILPAHILIPLPVALTFTVLYDGSRGRISMTGTAEEVVIPPLL